MLDERGVVLAEIPRVSPMARFAAARVVAPQRPQRFQFLPSGPRFASSHSIASARLSKNSLRIFVFDRGTQWQSAAWTTLYWAPLAPGEVVVNQSRRGDMEFLKLVLRGDLPHLPTIQKNLQTDGQFRRGEGQITRAG